MRLSGLPSLWVAHAQVEAQARGQEQRKRLEALMDEKERVGDCFNQLRLAFQRRAADRAPQVSPPRLLSPVACRHHPRGLHLKQLSAWPGGWPGI